jgi:HK97 family phage prohead protease
MSLLTREIAQNTAKIGLEKRVFEGKIELRSAKKDGNPGKIVGYAAKYNKLSVDLGGFFEKLAPGCFNSCMEDDCRCLRNHMDDCLLGRTRSGTLELLLDEIGLRYECELPNTTVGRDTAEMIARGDMSGSSFQFTIAMGGSDWDFDGPSPLRTITKIGRLYDVAPVAFPAYEDTSVDMRSFELALQVRNTALEAETIKRSIAYAKARVRLAAAYYR